MLPNKHVTTTKLSFVWLAAEQHHRAHHAGSTAGRTGLLVLTRQLTSASTGGRSSHVGAGVALPMLCTVMPAIPKLEPGSCSARLRWCCNLMASGLHMLSID
jgi:hypothetical protein